MTKSTTKPATVDEIREADEFLYKRQLHDATYKFRPFGLTIIERLRAEAEMAMKTGDRHMFERASRGASILGSFVR